MISGHGDDQYRYGHIVANFSSNVYQATDNTSLMKYLGEVLVRCSQAYPEPEPYSLQSLLAAYHHVAPEQVIVTNGATEAIYLIAHLFAGQEVSIKEPTFSEYRSASLLYKSPINVDADILWLCNPNNPTGQVLSEDYKGKTLIIDRSYEYYTSKPLPPLLLDDHHIYIYSLTKRYKIPGLRIGYILASHAIATKLRELRQPWSVNALAIEAGLWIVRQGFPETIDRSQLWAEAARLKEVLEGIQGVCVTHTDTHFMLLTTPIPSAILKEELALNHGILIRDASNFCGLSPYHIRIATQERSLNDLLIATLKDKLTAL